MAADAELTRLIAEKARVQKSIKQIEDDNTVQGSFEDISIRRNELRELNAQRDRINVRIQRRKGQLLKLRDPIWGSVIRATRCPPDGVDTQLGDYTIDETDPVDPTPTPATITIYVWGSPTDDVPTGIPSAAATTEGVALTFPDQDSDFYIIIAQESSEDDFTAINEGGLPQLEAYTKGAATFAHDGTTYEYWITNREQVGGEGSGGEFHFAR